MEFRIVARKGVTFMIMSRLNLIFIHQADIGVSLIRYNIQHTLVPLQLLLLQLSASSLNSGGSKDIQNLGKHYSSYIRYT